MAWEAALCRNTSAPFEWYVPRSSIGAPVGNDERSTADRNDNEYRIYVKNWNGCVMRKPSSNGYYC
jgi:hypothetical protein